MDNSGTCGAFKVGGSRHGDEAKPIDIIVNYDEMLLQRELEEIEEILGVLDGQLSLKNATLMVEVQ